MGYENRDIADQDFRDDTVDAGEIGAGHTVTALYALRLTGEGGAGDRIGTLRLRWTDPDSHAAQETALDVRAGDLAQTFRSTSGSFRLDALVAAAAEVFRHSRWADGYSIGDVANAAYESSGDLPRGEQTDDFLRFLDEAARIER